MSRISLSYHKKKLELCKKFLLHFLDLKNSFKKKFKEIAKKNVHILGYTGKRRLFCDFHKLLQRQAACARMNVAPLDGPRASREIQLWRRILLDLVLEKALWKKICVQSPTRLCCTMNYTIVFSGILFLLFATSLASEAEDAAKARAKGSKCKLFILNHYKFGLPL